MYFILKIERYETLLNHVINMIQFDSTPSSYLIFWIPVFVYHVAEPVEHDLVSPPEDLVAVVASQLAVGGSPVPIHAPHYPLSKVELVFHLPLRNPGVTEVWPLIKFFSVCFF